MWRGGEVTRLGVCRLQKMGTRFASLHMPYYTILLPIQIYVWVHNNNNNNNVYCYLFIETSPSNCINCINPLSLPFNKWKLLLPFNKFNKLSLPFNYWDKPAREKKEKKTQFKQNRYSYIRNSRKVAQSMSKNQR